MQQWLSIIQATGGVLTLIAALVNVATAVLVRRNIGNGP